MDEEKNPEKPTSETPTPETGQPNNQPEPETSAHIKHAHKLVYGYLILLVLAALAGMGGYWYHKNHKVAPATVTKSSKATQTSTTSYFAIRGWGVRAPYNGSLNLQYVVNSSDSVALSSSQLAAGGPAVCASTDNGEAGILGRYLPYDSNLGPKVPASETAQQYIDQNSSVPHAKVGSYIYIYWGNNYITNGSYNGPCSNKTAAMQTISAFSALVPKLQAVPNSSATDPYAGWKTYTDTAHHYSFKYPSDWTISTTSAQVMLLNTSESIEVDYLYSDPHDSGITSFTPVSIGDMTDASLGLKVVGGLYDGVSPEYNVIDPSLLKSYPLTIGQPSQFIVNPHFSDDHVTNGMTTGTFRARSAVSGAKTAAWFSTPDAKTSLLILESLRYQ
jgi:hypothetical protein